MVYLPVSASSFFPHSSPTRLLRPPVHGCASRAPGPAPRPRARCPPAVTNRKGEHRGRAGVGDFGACQVKAQVSVRGLPELEAGTASERSRTRAGAGGALSPVDTTPVDTTTLSARRDGTRRGERRPAQQVEEGRRIVPAASRTRRWVRGSAAVGVSTVAAARCLQRQWVAEDDWRLPAARDDALLLGDDRDAGRRGQLPASQRGSRRLAADYVAAGNVGPR